MERIQDKYPFAALLTSNAPPSKEIYSSPRMHIQVVKVRGRHRLRRDCDAG